MLRGYQIWLIGAAVAWATLLGGCHQAKEKKGQILGLANQFFDKGDYDKAKIEYLALLRLDPQRSDLTALQRLGFIWLEEGAPLQAYPYLLKARELAPENLAVKIEFARVLGFLGARAAAKEEAMVILSQCPGQEESLFVLIDSIGSEKDVEDVKKQLARIPENNDVTYHLTSAGLAGRTGDFAYAHAELQEVIKLAPRLVRAHSMMAKLYSLQHNWNKAGEEFRIAAELSPARSTARLSYAEFQKQVGKTEEAVRTLKEIVRQMPDYLPAWSLLADIALSQGKSDEALSLLENVLARDPTNRDALILQARAWMAAGDTKKALDRLEHLAKMYSEAPSINYYLAQAYIAAGNLDSADSALADAISAQPDYTEAILIRGQLDLRRGKAALAVPPMLQLLKAHPGLAPASMILADAYRAAGRLDDAATAIRDQIQTSGDSADEYVRLGVVLRDQAKIEEARDAFERAADLPPHDLRPVEELVDLDLAQKNFDRAMQTIAHRFAHDPEHAETYFLKGKVYAAQGQWNLAETAFRKSLGLDPNNSEAFDCLIFTFVSTQKFDQAIDELQRLLSRSPNSVRGWASLARIYTLSKDYPKARDTYEKLLSMNPDSTEAMNNLAYLYSEYLGQLDKAYELAQKAKALQPGDPLIADTLGWTLYKRGDYAEALTVLRKSAEKLGGSADAQVHFGMASYMMLKTRDALVAFKKAFVNNADVQSQLEARRRMELLEQDAIGSVPPEQLKAVVAKDPTDVVAWTRLAEWYERQDAFAKAAEADQESLNVNPELFPAALSLARLYDGPLNDLNMAFVFAKRAKDLAPNDDYATAVLGRIVYRLGNFTWAYSLLQESARKLPDDPKILRDYAWSAYSLSKIPESRQLMQRVIGLHPDRKIVEEANSFITMTDLEQAPERLASSDAEIQAVLATDPTHVPALLAKARLQVQRGDAKSAIGIYADILQRYPDFAPAQKYLAELYAKDSARIDEAYSLALRARNALPNDADLATTLAEISYQKQDFSYAIQCFLESARSKPLQARDLYYLGMAQLRVGQESASAKTLEKALSVGLEEPMLREAQAAVTELHKRAGL